MQAEAPSDEMKAQLAEARAWQERQMVVNAAMLASQAQEPVVSAPLAPPESAPPAPSVAPAAPQEDPLATQPMEDADVIVPESQPMFESQPQE